MRVCRGYPVVESRWYLRRAARRRRARTAARPAARGWARARRAPGPARAARRDCCSPPPLRHTRVSRRASLTTTTRQARQGDKHHQCYQSAKRPFSLYQCRLTSHSQWQYNKIQQFTRTSIINIILI